MDQTPDTPNSDSSDPMSSSKGKQSAGNSPAPVELLSTPHRSGSRHNSSSASLSRLETYTMNDFTAEDMAEPIKVDLETAQECKALRMIEYLFAFCLSDDNKEVPARQNGSLLQAFEKVREIANRNDTALVAQLSKFREAKNELSMYDPFVLACNHALDGLSEIDDVDGLPEFTAQKRIVFVRNFDRAVRSDSHQRESRERPDIVLLQWDIFKNKLKTPQPLSYSDSHKTDICVKKLDFEVAWGEVRSTVEMKVSGLPKPGKWERNFDGSFPALEELPPYVSLDDARPPTLSHNAQPVIHHPTRSSERSAAQNAHIMKERRFPISSDKKRKNDSEISDGNKMETTSKRAKTGDSSRERSVTKDTEDSEKAGGAGASGPRAIPMKHPVNVQNGIYAAERLSCDLEITHSINFILRGSVLYITWSDRQSVIRAGGFDLLKNLPHFLLVLLIIQRFNLARWGFFTEFEGSKIHSKENTRSINILEATFEDDKKVKIFPTDDPVCRGVCLSGRSTAIVGARAGDDQDGDMSTSEQIRRGNRLVAKFSWPNESRESEVKFIERAKAIGENNDLVKDRIPTIIGHTDPPYLTCSTKIIRQFLGLDTDRARVLRVIVFHRLEEIKYLDQEDMLIAFLDCFFCHWALWANGIEHGDISIGNLMYDPSTKRGVLNDFDLARWGAPDRQPTAKDNTGTLPFLALDLLDEEAFKGLVRRLYRHDAESFTWCLIYICICMEKGSDGRIGTQKPHPLSPWFENLDSCFRSKNNLVRRGLPQFPLHQNIRLLVVALFTCWMDRFQIQSSYDLSEQASLERARVDEGDEISRLLPSRFVKPKPAPKTEPYKELPPTEWFKRFFNLLLEETNAVPRSRANIFSELVVLVATLYPFVERGPLGSEEGASS